MINDTTYERQQFTVSDFKLLQVFPVTDYLAVYAEEDQDDPTKYKLVAHPIHLLALADVVESTIESGDGKPVRVLSIHDPFRAIVGVDLSEGGFDICNEDRKFAGICREGDDISKVDWHLNIEYAETLPGWRVSDG